MADAGLDMIFWIILMFRENQLKRPTKIAVIDRLANFLRNSVVNFIRNSQVVLWRLIYHLDRNDLQYPFTITVARSNIINARTCPQILQFPPRKILLVFCGLLFWLKTTSQDGSIDPLCAPINACKKLTSRLSALLDTAFAQAAYKPRARRRWYMIILLFGL